MFVKNYFEYKSNNSFVYHNISQIFRRMEAGLFIFLCLALIITSKIHKPTTDKISMAIVTASMPVAKVTSLPFNLVVKSITGFQELVDAKRKNQMLLQENEKLKSLYIRSLNINQENQQLKDILKYVGLRSNKYSVARLISSPYQVYSRNVFIDAGKNQNISEDDIVTGNNALIGRIAQVDESKSRIILATDINSRIPIITSGARVKGILAGNNSDTMEILYLEKNHHINVGDLVFTSGDGDSMPPGLLIGAVTKVDDKSVSVEMIENVRNLDIVSVINY